MMLAGCPVLPCCGMSLSLLYAWTDQQRAALTCGAHSLAATGGWGDKTGREREREGERKKERQCGGRWTRSQISRQVRSSIPSQIVDDVHMRLT
ncbi:hypothetical protein LZ30DRAFT_710275 [Colletotrichum cereale]|nr:hypothetical protein LZ30DRAFT_710275 [Colletotrichum cereale]